MYTAILLRVLQTLKGLYGLETSEFGISDRLRLTEVTFRIYHMCSFLTD
mgnify:CR=1 FL=1